MHRNSALPVFAAIAVMCSVVTRGAAAPEKTLQSGPSARWQHIAIWTDQEMLIWGGSVRNERGINIPVEDGWRYNPQANAWSPMSRAGAPSPRTSNSGVWTGQELIVWGGFSGGVRRNDGAAYNPRTDSWRLLPTDGAPSERAFHTAVWTGSE